MEWTRRKVAVVGLAVLVGVGSLAVAGAAAYFAVGLGPEATALATVEADDRVTVERFDRGTIVRSGPVTTNTTGLVYYPGARVNHESYVPMAAQLVTERDVVVVVVDMPLNLAILAPNRADAAREAVPAVESWYVGGHSLGGAMACRYAADSAAKLEGLVLHASYCGDDVSDTDLRVLSVLGADDGVTDAEREREARALLPPGATVVELPAVNHAGFGAYGAQRGDRPAPRAGAEMRADVAHVTGNWIVSGTVSVDDRVNVSAEATSLSADSERAAVVA